MSNTPVVPKLENFDVTKDWMHVFGKQTSAEKNQDVVNKQQPSGYVDRNHFRSISSTQPAPEAYDRKVAETKVAQTLKNPLKAPNPQLQLIAHGAKLTRLASDPKFQGLNDNLKLMVLQHYYNKYTEPILKANGVAPPGFDKWVRGQHAAIYDQDTKPKQSLKGEFVSGVTSGTADLSRIIANGIRYKLPWTTKLDNKTNQAVADKVLGFAHNLDTLNQNYNSVFQTDHSVSGWLANTGGHLVGEMPAYVLLDAATSGVMPTIEGLAEASPKMLKAIKFAKEGGEIFAVDKAEDKKTSVAASDAIVGPVIGMALRGVGGVVRKGLNQAGQTILNHVNAKGTQLAVMGKPFANTIEHEADRLEEGNKWLESGEPEKKTQSFINTKSPIIQNLAKNEQALREQIARQYYGHKVNPDSPDSSVWRNLSKAQRGHIKQYINEMTQLSAEAMPLTSPHVQTLANEAELEAWTKEAPENDATYKMVKQLTGLNPAEVLTEAQAEKVAGQMGVNTPTQHLDQAFNDAEEYEPGEGATASLSPGYKVNFANRVDNSSPKDIVGSSTEGFINKTIKYLPDSAATKSGKVYFEHPEHHLLWIANNSNAPAIVRRKALVHLAQEFGHSASKVDRRAGWLKEHVDDLQRTGILNKEGNVYRSTKLTQRRFGTTWQQQLYTEDTLNSQMSQLRTLMKQNPALKKTIKPVLEQLIQFKNKGVKPETVGLRADAIDRMIESMQGMR